MATNNKKYETLNDLPTSIPVFPLTGALLLPGGQIPLNIFEPRYLAMIDAALASNRMIGMIQPAFETASITENGLCKVGCAGRITSFNEVADNRYVISLTGISRFTIAAELETTTPFRQVLLDWEPYTRDLQPDDTQDEIDRSELLKTFRDYLEANNMSIDWDNIQETKTEILVNTLSMMSPYGAAEKQALLEAATLKKRAETLIAITEISLVRHDNKGDVTLQ